jgi:uncharacterized membrane protein
VAALSPESAATLPATREVPPEDLDDVRAMALRLELIPRGVGKLEGSASSLFEEIRRGETARMELVLRNIGTRAVDNIRLHADAPSDWQVTIDPPMTPRLDPGGEVRVLAELAPPESVQVGDFPVRLRTEPYADNRRIESQDQTARIHVVAPPGYAAMSLLGLLVIGLMTGLVYWGVRVTRR